MYKFLITLLIMFLSVGVSFGASPLQTKVNNIINSDPLSKTAVVAVSVRDIKTGAVVVDKQASVFMRPASTQKLLTSAAIYNKWGRNYDIKTIVYRFKNDLYIKVLGDPLLTFDELKKNS